MTSQDKFCSFFFFPKDYLADNLKFYSLGNIIYIEDSFHKLTNTVKLLKLANASLLALVLIQAIPQWHLCQYAWYIVILSNNKAQLGLFSKFI